MQIINNDSDDLVTLIINNNSGIKDTLKREKHLSKSKKWLQKLLVKNCEDSILATFVKKKGL